MLKEVGASGQISLGKKYAGQLFDVVFYPDGRVELVPMKAVPANRATEMRPVALSDGRSPPRGYEECSQWALENRAALDAYAQRIVRDGTAAEQLQQYLACQGYNGH